MILCVRREQSLGAAPYGKKAGAPKKKKAKPKLSDKEQSERFIKTARELGVDESGASFERAADKLLPARSSEDHKDKQH